MRGESNTLKVKYTQSLGETTQCDPCRFPRNRNFKQSVHLKESAPPPTKSLYIPLL